MIHNFLEWLFIPDIKRRVERQLAETRHQLLDALARQEAAEADVIMLKRRLSRLEGYERG